MSDIDLSIKGASADLVRAIQQLTIEADCTSCKVTITRGTKPQGQYPFTINNHSVTIGGDAPTGDAMKQMQRNLQRVQALTHTMR